jgi:undecaprenyl phosphate N,N'-diacetylbacillosamine 1-phosphate transferase
MKSFYRAYFKRFLDVFLAIVFLFCLWPLLLVIPFILYVVYGVSPWFRQARVGQFGKVFFILKFKTMHDIGAETLPSIPLPKRTTPIGAFLRKYSLDEIPQLINVLKGDMSLIGPRPLLTQYYHLFDDFQNRRHQVRPGITGLVQVSGRNALPWPKRFCLDAHYVATYDFALDFKILIKTAWVLLFEKQIFPPGIPEEPFEV